VGTGSEDGPAAHVLRMTSLHPLPVSAEARFSILVPNGRAS
jgi:hypothetical protein